MGLRRYDLNLLPVLDALLRRSNVTRASEDVGMSQSATSHALSRLRKQLGDELLVPSGRGMMLTRRAEELIAPLRGALEVLERLLDLGQFDPAVSRREFRLMTADYVAALILPKLQKEAAREAPDIRIHVTWGQGSLVDALLSHQLDVALMPRGSIEDPDIRSETLFEDELVVIAAKDNPAIRGKLDFATFQRLPQVVFKKDGSESSLSFADRQISHHALTRRETVTVPDFLLLPLVVSQTDCIALTHRHLAVHMSQAARIEILPPPFQTDPVVISAFWARTMDLDAGHLWFRDMIRRSCAASQFVPVAGAEEADGAASGP